jgi:signal transduction histidine kinase/ActR/RegA family two-component response regulator
MTLPPETQQELPPSSVGQRWGTLPVAARLYVAVVILGGIAGLWAFFPHTLSRPVMFAVLMAWACVTSTWKVNLPIPLANGATLSVSYAANLMSLLLLGPQDAVLIAAAGVVTQCTYKVKQPYPIYRTIFSTAAAVITMGATGAVYLWLGGTVAPFDTFAPARPLVGAIATYFLFNTSLIAAAIALSTSRTFLSTWRLDFLWSGASFMVAGTAGALAAVIVDQGEEWKAVLLIAPIYLTYRTYELFVGRLEDQKRHMEEVLRLHQETVGALGQAREAERALAAEKERLATTVAAMTRLEEARRHLFEREQSARASAEEANHLKDQFLAVVSHELRTPLNAILGWADILRRRKLDESARARAVRTILDSAKRQAQLVEDLLDVSRIMSGKLRLERTEVDLREVVREALQVVQPAADAKRIRVTVTADSPLGKVGGDAARLQQIAWNLLSNAVKFTPEGGSVDVRLCQVTHGVEMTVSDTGQGIPAHFLPAVFEAFRQGDGSTTRTHPGLGLGLSIVKNLVEAHGGTVGASSAGEGRGAAFTVRLPLAVPSVHTDKRRADEIAAGRPTVVSLDGLSVLIVDDDRQSRDVVAAHLQECHAAVLTATSAAQAFDILHQRRVDVLLADIGMPDEDGYSLIRRVRALAPPAVASIPAAALTAFARDEDRQMALQAGFQMHLPKPIDADSLVSAVARLGKLNVS